MKTLTITLHDTDNCGSSLQAYALQHFLISNGIQNEIINYTPLYTKNNGKPIKTFLRRMLYFSSSKRKDEKFFKFIQEHLLVTKERYYSHDELVRNPPTADFYLTGSDQLWNMMYTCGHDSAYYLDFARGTKLAYAVSMGRENIPNDNIEYVKKYSKDFKWISFREESSRVQLEHQLNCSVSTACDPVLLNDISEYDKIRVDKIIEEKYILVYVAQAANRVLLNDIVGQIKRKINAQIVFIGAYRNKCDCDVQLRDVSPGEFLSLIYNAEYIISNSFHATVFSMMYNKQFSAIVPEENGERIKMLLKKVGLEKQGVYERQKIFFVITEKQYTDVNEIIAKYKKTSGDLLLQYLGISKESK